MPPGLSRIAAAALGLLGALLLFLALPRADAARRSPVSVWPTPGTHTASARTTISFRGRSKRELGRIVVVGSRSGRHIGVLRAHPDGNGASFVPRRRFDFGESVLVRTALHVRGGHDGDFRFRTARPPGHTLPVPGPRLRRVKPGRKLAFRSRPDLTPPVVTVDLNSDGVAPGEVFLGPKLRAGNKEGGPLIVDDSGEPIWFHPLRGEQANDFRVQQYRGRPVLTWWQGHAGQGMGQGIGTIYDARYRLVRHVRAGNGYRADLHEFLLTPQDTALITIYHKVRRDLSPLGGSTHGVAVDSIVQEVDIRTGLVLFEWHSLGNVGLDESHLRPSRNPRVPYDYFHVNSIDVDSDGDLLVSARNTWTVYKISRRTGKIIWRLGGDRSNFTQGPGARFAWQHDVRRLPDGTITMFDNSASPAVRPFSRAITLSIDPGLRTANLVSDYAHPRRLLAASQGNDQRLPNGDVFVGWGAQRYFSEYAPGGGLVWDARVAVGYDTYRAYRMPWTGRPRTRPKLAVQRRARGRLAVFASWNGATEVATWEVLSGRRHYALAPVASKPRTGFETGISVRGAGPVIAALALDAAGHVIGRSRSVRIAR
jgi:hypothetical protein